MQRRFVADVSHELRTPLTTVRMAADVLYDHRNDFDAATARSAELLQVAAGPVRAAAHRPAGDQPVRRWRGGARARRRRPRRARSPGDRRRRGLAADDVAPRSRCTSPAKPVDGRGRRTPDRADRAQPRRQRDRVRRGPADRGAGRRQRRRGRACPCATTGSACATGEEVLVFNRFWRADPARAKTRGGTGLGLSIAVEDTELHEGKLDAWGRPGEGSVFRLTLPRRVGDEVRRLAAAARAELRSLSRAASVGPTRGYRHRRPRGEPMSACVGRRAVASCVAALVLVVRGLRVASRTARRSREADRCQRRASSPSRSATSCPGRNRAPTRRHRRPASSRRCWRIPQSSAVAREFLTPAAADSVGSRASRPSSTPTSSWIDRSGRRHLGARARDSGTLNDRGSWTTAAARRQDDDHAASGSSRSAASGGSPTRSPALFDRRRDSLRPADLIDPFSLYFIDPTQKVLTPDPVYLALGDTTATALVSDLLLGPVARARAESPRSGAPAGTQLDAAVSIARPGVAEVPLSAEFLQLSRRGPRAVRGAACLDAAAGPGDPRDRRSRSTALRFEIEGAATTSSRVDGVRRARPGRHCR